VAELGYVLSRKYWGKGITTAAVIKAVQEGFSQFKLSRVEAFVDPQNVASQRVLDKSGMQLEGLLKSYMLFKGQISDRYIYANRFKGRREPPTVILVRASAAPKGSGKRIQKGIIYKIGTCSERTWSRN
jgi:hypothetical protein